MQLAHLFKTCKYIPGTLTESTPGAATDFSARIITDNSTITIFTIMPGSSVVYRQHAGAGNTCFENVFSLLVEVFTAVYQQVVEFSLRDWATMAMQPIGQQGLGDTARVVKIQYQGSKVVSESTLYMGG